MSTVDGCPLCDRENSIAAVDDGGWVYRDQWWSVGVLPGVEVPGWLVIQSRTHVIPVWEIDPDGQAVLGPLASRAAEAISAATGAGRVYMTAFGEAMEHWHMLLAARPEGLPPEGRGPGLIAAHQPHVDRERAAEVAAQVRAALADFHQPVGEPR